MKEVKEHVQELLRNSFIQLSIATESSNLACRQMDGGKRLCADYQALKRATIKKKYPLT